MSDNKKYYYLKVKDNFYESEEMIILQNMNDGYLYSDILMKLYLRSLKNNGKLMFNDLIPYTPSVLAQIVRHQEGTVEKALKIFQELGLIEILDNGAIYMMNIQNFIGESSTEADRKRQYRSQIQSEVKKLGQKLDKCPDKNPPEIEKEIELDINNNIYGQNGSNEQSKSGSQGLGEDNLGGDEDDVTKAWETQFEKFYRAYPKKVKKQEVKKWFKKNKPSNELFSSIIDSLEQFRASSDWQKDGGQFIPYPSTWLNQKRWEDETIQIKETANKNNKSNFDQRQYGNLNYLYQNKR